MIALKNGIKFLKIAETYDYLTRRMYLPALGLYYLHSWLTYKSYLRQSDTRNVTHFWKSLTRNLDPKFCSFFSFSSHSSATGLMKHVGGGPSFFMNPLEGTFCDVWRSAASRTAARLCGAICIFGVVNTSVAYRERPGAYFRPCI